MPKESVLTLSLYNSLLSNQEYMRSKNMPSSYSWSKNIRWNIWKLFGKDLLTEQDKRENMRKCLIRWFNSCSIKLIIFLFYFLFCFKADEKEERYLRRQKRRAELDSKQKEKEEDVNASKKQEKTEAEESVPEKGIEGAKFSNNLGHHLFILASSEHL